MNNGSLLPDGDAVRKCRKAKGWTQEVLAEKVGCSKKTIENVEASKPTRCGTLRDIAEALEVELESLLSDDEAASDGEEVPVFSKSADVGGVAIATDTVFLELRLAVDFDSFAKEDQDRLLEGIRQLLRVDGGILIVGKKRGSVLLTLQLDEELALRLVEAIKNDELASFHVVDAVLREDPRLPHERPRKFGVEEQRRMFAGVNRLAHSVRSTLGPRGRRAVLDAGWGSPNRELGPRVAEHKSNDPYENLGVQLVKEAASKTNQVAGDGTTTATVLAEAIYREGLKMVAAGADPMVLSRGIQKATEVVVDGIAKLSKKIDENSRTEICQIATIAGNNDSTIGDVLAVAFLKVGKDGVIVIEKSRQAETTVEIVDGMQFERGYCSPHFVTNEKDETVELEDCLILPYGGRISDANDLVRLLEAVSNAARPLLIIADEIEAQALATLVVNKLRGIVNVAAVKTPGYGGRQKAVLEDIATLVGGKAIFNELASVKISDLGKAKKIIIDAENTTIVGGAGSKAAINSRAEQIRCEIEATEGGYDRDKLQERLAKLTGLAVRINCGGTTEAEAGDRKSLIEDAKCATQAALEEGIVPGGGVALIRAGKDLEKLQLEGDERLGANIIANILDLPLRLIAENSGVDGSTVVNRVRQMKSQNEGYDAQKDSYGDMLAFGIIDPAKVVRSALQNGASVATLLLTTDTLLTDSPP
jgi:chaperonin GroEL